MSRATSRANHRGVAAHQPEAVKESAAYIMIIEILLVALIVINPAVTKRW
jgi:hypothetical protein